MAGLVKMVEPGVDFAVIVECVGRVIIPRLLGGCEQVHFHSPTLAATNRVPAHLAVRGDDVDVLARQRSPD